MTDGQVSDLFKTYLDHNELNDLEFFVRYKRKFRSYTEFMEVIIGKMFPSEEKLSTDCLLRNKDLFLESSMFGLDSFRLFTISMEQLNQLRYDIETNQVDTSKIDKLINNYFLTTSTERKYYTCDEKQSFSVLILKMLVIILNVLLTGCYDNVGTYIVGLYKGDLVCMKLI